MTDVFDFKIDQLDASVFDNIEPSQNKDHLYNLETLITILTSPNEIDYQLIGDFFLTFRSFISQRSLLKILLLRFQWCLDVIDDESHEQKQNIGKLTLIRSFVVLRHWILNYFSEDFLPSQDLRIDFIEYINHSTDGSLFVQRIIANLKQTWTFCCNKSWDEEVNSGDFYKFKIKVGPQANKNKRLSTFALNQQTDPITRNSIILSTFEKNKIHKLPIPTINNQNKIVLKLNNSNHRFNGQHRPISENQKAQSPLYRSLSSTSAATTKSTIRDSTEFIKSPNLSKVLPPTPVKKMDYVVQLPPSNNSMHKNNHKGIKSLVDSWLKTFNLHSDNKLKQNKAAEYFMNNVVSIEKADQQDLGLLNTGKFDILSARTIDELEYLVRFHNELVKSHGTKLGINAFNDSFTFTINEPPLTAAKNMSNIDNLNICETISLISKSVISLQQLKEGDRKSYISYDSVISKDKLTRTQEASEVLKRKPKNDNLNEFNFDNSSGPNPYPEDMDDTPNITTSTPMNENESGPADTESIIDGASPQSIEDSVDHAASEENSAEKAAATPTFITVEHETNDQNKINSPRFSFISQSSNFADVESSEDHITSDGQNSSDNHLTDDIATEDSVSEGSVLEDGVSKDDPKSLGEASTIDIPTAKIVEETYHTSETLQMSQGEEADISNSKSRSLSFQDVKPAASSFAEIHIADDLTFSSVSSPPNVNLGEEVPIGFDTENISEAQSFVSIVSSVGSTFDGLGTEAISDMISGANDSGRSHSDEPNTPPLSMIISSTPHISPIHAITESTDTTKQSQNQLSSVANFHSKLDLNRVPSFTRVSDDSIGSNDTPNKFIGSVERHSYLSQRSNQKTVRHPSHDSGNSIFSNKPKNLVNLAINHKSASPGKRREIVQSMPEGSSEVKESNSVLSEEVNSINSENFKLPYAGVNSAIMAELAAISDESFQEDPISTALLKLEGSYKKSPLSEQNVPSAPLIDELGGTTNIKNTDGLILHETPKRSKRASVFIDQRRKTKVFSLTPVKQKVIAYDKNSSKVLLELLLNRNITDDALQVSNAEQHIPFILNYKSKTLAEQFTLIEKDALLEIDWKELIELKWDSDKLVSINSWIELLIQNREMHGVDLCVSRFNLSVNWIISEILLTKDITLRKLTIQRFIHIAQNCKTLQNYSTLLQILLALGSDKIIKLADTWRIIEPGDLLIYKNLEAIASPVRNFAVLRNELNKIKPSLGCVPFLGLYLSDLVFNKEKKVHVGQKINFAKFKHDSKIVRSLIQYIQWSTLYRLKVEDEVLSKCLYIKALTEDEMNDRLQNILSNQK